MSANLDRIADLALNRPLLLHPDKLAVVAHVLGNRLGFDMPAPELNGPDASRFVGSRQRGRDVTMSRVTERGTAMIEVHGTLVNRGAWLNSSSGLTSYEGIRAQLTAAGADPAVKAILLDIDSPGGQAVGAFETADAVRALAAVKPVVAVVDGLAASAAYAIASAATKIVTTRSGILGSIGVVLLHLDHSRRLDKEGITPTLIHAGARKVDGNPVQPLSDATKASLQGEVDKLMQLFAETVAAGRGSKLTKAMALATEAGVYAGADAVKAGLADEVGTFANALAAIERGAVRAGPARPGGLALTSPAASSEKRFTRAELDAARAAGFAEGLEEVRAEAVAEGGRLERERWAAVSDGLQFSGHQDAALHLLGTTSMSADKIIDFLNALPKPTAGLLAPDGSPALRAKDAPFGLVLAGPPPAAPSVPDASSIYEKRAATVRERRDGR